MSDALRYLAPNWTFNSAVPLDQTVFEGLFWGTIETGNGGQIKFWDGAAFEFKPVKFWTGAAWVTKPIKRWSGTEWL